MYCVVKLIEYRARSITFVVNGERAANAVFFSTAAGDMSVVDSRKYGEVKSITVSRAPGQKEVLWKIIWVDRGTSRTVYTAICALNGNEILPTG